MPAKKAKLKPVEELSFEEAFAELETLVAQLQAPDVPLDEALALFERGQALSAHCGQTLEAAELKVQTLIKHGDTFRTESFMAKETE